MTLPRIVRQAFSWPLYGGSFRLSPVEQCCFDLVSRELPEAQRTILITQLKSIFRIQHWIKGRMTHISFDPLVRVEPFSDIPEEHCLAAIQYVETVSKRKQKVYITCHRGKLKTIEGVLPSDTAQMNGAVVTLNPKVKPITAEALNRVEHEKETLAILERHSRRKAREAKPNTSHKHQTTG